MSAIHIEVFSRPFTGTGNALMKKGTVIINIPTVCGILEAHWLTGVWMEYWNLAYFDYAQKTDELNLSTNLLTCP